MMRISYCMDDLSDHLMYNFKALTGDSITYICTSIVYVKTKQFPSISFMSVTFFFSYFHSLTHTVEIEKKDTSACSRQIRGGQWQQYSKHALKQIKRCLLFNANNPRSYFNSSAPRLISSGKD